MSIRDDLINAIVKHLRDEGVDPSYDAEAMARALIDVAAPGIEATARADERRRIAVMCDGYRASMYADERAREATKPARDALAWVVAKLREPGPDE